MKIKWKALMLQFFKFGIVGLTNAIIQLTVYYLLMHIGLSYAISYGCGFILSVLNAYILNKKFVFKVKDVSAPQTLASVYLCYGITFILSELLLFLEIDILNIYDKIAPIINIIVLTPVNFLLNKFFAFGKRKVTKTTLT